MKINGLLMSAMKSGSTWFLRLCAEHPELFVLTSGQFPVSPEGAIESIDWSGYSGEKLRLGRRNLKLEKHYVAAYKRHNPEMKFLCLLREPVARCYSHFGHVVRKRHKQWRPLPLHSSQLDDRRL